MCRSTSRKPPSSTTTTSRPSAIACLLSDRPRPLSWRASDFRAFAAAQQHRFFLLADTSEERYLRFTTGFPEFVQRIPQYMVASYLGFTPELISKLKSRRHPKSH